MTINEIQDEVIEAFGFFDEWTDKYEYLIDLNKELPLIDESKKTEEYLIKGCQSQVWVDAKMNGDVIKLTADSDALITSGIISLILKVLNNQKPEDILNADLYFLDKIGLVDHLSMNRSNGLISMIDKIREYARQFNNE